MKKLIVGLLASLSSASHAQSCYESMIVSPTPFLGNNDEVFKLADGSIWQVKYEYEYLYEYNPSVIICPSKGKLYVGKKQLNVQALSAGRGDSGHSGRAALPRNEDVLPTEFFDYRAVAAAFIDDDLVVHLWSGEPVAYLETNGSGSFHLYGFNGKHLGWLERGVMRDHDGNAACAPASAFRDPPRAPFKSLRSLKPLKGLKELAPLKPLMSSSWGDLPCKTFLSAGTR